MRLIVKLWVVKQEVCVIETPDFAQAREQIGQLNRNDFQDVDEYHDLEVFTEAGDEVTGEIQPITPNL